MNKFDFVINQKIKTNIVLDERSFSKDFLGQIRFNFTSNKENNDIIDFNDNRAGLTGRIVKSEIKENVIEQLKLIKERVKSSGEELLYFKMNENTKRKFRMFYSYEVDSIPRNLNNEDKKIGKIIGNIMGIKIVRDNSLEDDFIQLVVSVNNKSKFDKIFSEEF